MKNIEIYPSSWYYNACIHGFLETLAWGLGDEGDRIVEKQILQEDGSAVIPGQIAEAIFSDESVSMPADYFSRPVPNKLAKMKRVAWWWAGKSYEEGFIRKEDKEKELDPLEKVETVSRNLFNYKHGHYGNLAQLKWDKIDFLNRWFNKKDDSIGDEICCSFCGRLFTPEFEPKVRIFDLFFTRSLSAKLGSTPDEFPNLFWDNKPNLPICRICRSYFLHFHLVYQKRFFINTDSLQSNWYLNRLISGKLRGKTFQYQRALLDAMWYDPQFKKGISGWGLQNMEIVLFERGEVRYYPVSTRLAKLLLVPQISSLLGKLVNQEKLWDCTIRERFDYLPVIVYKSLHVFLTEVNIGNDIELINTRLKDNQPIVDAIELYNEIKKNLSREKGGSDVNYLRTKEIRRAAASAPLSLKDKMVYRLLELTRMNRKADVYHLLLRTYVVKEMTFPDVLAHLFTIRDVELFKTGIYAFISGLRPETEEAADK